MLSFKEYLDQDKQLTLECKAYIIAYANYNLGNKGIHLKEEKKRMSILLKQLEPSVYKNYPDGFLILNPQLPETFYLIACDITKYGLLTGFWNPDGYGLPYYLDKPNPDWVNAAMCANVQEKSEQKQIAKLAKQLYEELKSGF